MSTDCVDDRFSVGKVVGVHGLAGCMKIRPSTNNPDLLLDMTAVFVGKEGDERMPCSVEEIRMDKKNMLLKVKEIADRTEAEKLVGCQVETLRSQVRDLDEDEWWARDLVGLPVFTTDGALVGTIFDVIGEQGQFLEIENASHQGEERILVPFVKALVPVVDIRARRIEVVNLPGLLD